ncbi:MAG: hypothetical protein OEU89_00145 [Burkholderiaceae bacterium]|nr:hypothetical protein [Burkholderiaceae bacterium]
MDISATLESCKILGEFVEYLWGLRSKLVAQREPAAHELALAVEEVHKTFNAVANEIARYKSLGVTTEALQKGASILPELEGRLLRARVDAARGHCTIIDNIYVTHLDRWFNRVLSKEEYNKIKFYFSELRNADGDLFKRMCSICDNISREATQVHDLVLEKKWAKARERILSSSQSLRDAEQKLAAPMGKMNDLMRDFIASSGVTRLN